MKMNMGFWEKYNGITLWWNNFALVAIPIVHFSMDFIWNTESVFFPHILSLSGARTTKIEKLHIEDVKGLHHYLCTYGE